MAAAYYVGEGSVSMSAHSACDAPGALGGTPIAAQPAVSSEADGARRTETYTIDAAGLAGGAIDLCVSVGEILVEPATGDSLSLEFRIRSDHPGATEATIVDAEFASRDGRLLVNAWQAQAGRSTGWFGGDGATVTLILHVPESGAYDLDARVDVGDARVNDLLLRELSLTSDVGNAIANGVDLTGNASAISDVGDAMIVARSVQSATIRVIADIGNAEVEVPRRAEIGYDVEAETGVGEVFVDIGETESRESEGDGPGERETARSTGYATKPTRVVIVVGSDVGDARVRAV